MAEPLNQRGIAFLQRRVGPMSPTLPGSVFMPRADQVLRLLAQASDEREYQRMIDTQSSISSAIGQRITGLLQEGWEWAPGASGTKNAARLADFVGSFMGDPELRMSTVLGELLETIFLGWRPCETIWKVEPWEGSPRLVPKKLICHKPWNFRFTVDGKLALMKAGGLATAILYDIGLEQAGEITEQQFENQLKWQIATAGSTLTPYGRSALQPLWLLWFVRHEFGKMSDKAIARALGTFKAKYHASGLGDVVPGTVDQITKELETVFQVLDANGVLVELSNWSLEAMDMKVNMVESLDKLWRYFDDQFRIAIVGQTLTSSQGRQGSQALGKVHENVLRGYQRSDGRQLQVWMNILAQRMVIANFGKQDDQRDYPSFMLRAFSRPDLPATALFFNMGGKVDARKYAERLNVPAALDEPDEDDVVLQRQEGSQEVQIVGAAIGGSTQQQPTVPAARAADDNRQADAIARITAGGLQPAERGDLYRSLVQDLLADNSDPH